MRSNSNVQASGKRCVHTLACYLATGRDVLPVIAQYQDIPYAAAAGVPDPAWFSLLVFDDRCLAASSELNLLNIIHLASVR
jgi:hypothetical protein